MVGNVGGGLPAPLPRAADLPHKGVGSFNPRCPPPPLNVPSDDEDPFGGIEMPVCEARCVPGERGWTVVCRRRKRKPGTVFVALCTVQIPITLALKRSHPDQLAMELVAVFTAGLKAFGDAWLSAELGIPPIDEVFASGTHARAQGVCVCV